MRTQARRLIMSCCIVAAAASAHAAGTVDVSFVDAARFADAGTSPSAQQANLRTIASYLQALGERHLAAAQVLKIEVLDVDLGGHVKFLRRRVDDARVAKGMADWPRINVRYSLQTDGKVMRSGEESIGDMNYLGHVASYHTMDPLRHEKQMLERWFKSRFVEQRTPTD